MYTSVSENKQDWRYRIKIKRNCYGQAYSRCSICVNKKGTLGSEVFITEDGNKYHNSLMCSGLLRNIITVEKSKVKICHLVVDVQENNTRLYMAICSKILWAFMKTVLDICIRRIKCMKYGV